MKKEIKVSKISVEALHKLHQLGYTVLIEQITMKPANPEQEFALRDAISILKSQRKRGLDPIMKVTKPLAKLKAKYEYK